MSEKLFVLPFVAGLTILFIILILRGIKWYRGLSKIDRLRLVQSLKTRRTLVSLKEIFMECLLHHNIFKKNKMLGYMHMSLAFGWFLLIVAGHLESFVAHQSLIVPLYLPVFFRYFEGGMDYSFAKGFAFIMDLLLLFVLSGVALAIIKRFYKKLFGMKKTTRLKLGDQVAMTALWFIFPLRLLAESITAGIHQNGSFFTNSIGNLFANPQINQLIETPIWLAYSFSLGFFFIALPYSRYMHIPTEVLLITMRNAGIQLKKLTDTYTEVEVLSCSRCGLCLDNCQMSTAGISDSQSVYLLKSIRNHNLDDEQLFNCLLCGKCQIDCPVGIDTVGLRVTQRIESTRQYNSRYDYLKESVPVQTDVVYFAGCMTHLTPGIIRSMDEIFKAAKVNYWFLDKDKAPCCGRPLMLAGQYEAASQLIENNTKQILNSGAKQLVVSCPICYKVFKEDYNFKNIEVLFHAEYILRLIEEKKIHLEKGTSRMVYHDPCELGRGMGMYKQPRQLLDLTGTLVPIKTEKEKAFCCGGSLGNLKIKQSERNKISNMAIDNFLTYQPDILATSCPLCKKTFSRNKNIVVKDIAEIVAGAIISFDHYSNYKMIKVRKTKSKHEVVL
jgi:Fe-S oxidoreductase